jgi:hypothetical protein
MERRFARDVPSVGIYPGLKQALCCFNVDFIDGLVELGLSIFARALPPAERPPDQFIDSPPLERFPSLL